MIYSPLGRVSGAHINPAITLAFFRLGKIKAWDVGFYILAQFTGALIGVSLFALILGSWASDPNVNYIVTVPEAGGVVAAFFAEIAITFAMMLLVLRSTNSTRFAPYTGLLAGALLPFSSWRWRRSLEQASTRPELLAQRQLLKSGRLSGSTS